MQTLRQVTRRLADAEAFAIAAVIADKLHAARLVSRLTPEDFADEAHASLWAACARLFDDHGSVRYSGLVAAGVQQDALQAVWAKRDQLDPEVDPLEHLISTRGIFELHTRYSTGMASLATGEANPVELRQIATGVQYAVEEVLAGVVVEREGRTAESLAIEAFAQHSASWHATYGVKAFDEATGGLTPGTFHVLGAPSGHGKSGMALTAALRTAQRGLRTLYVTKEMRDLECAKRVAAMILGCTFWEMAQMHAAGKLAPALAGRVPENLSFRHDLSTPAAIHGEVRRAELEGDPYRLVVVDYLQQYKPPGKSEVERLDAAVEALKDLAMQSKCAVLSPAQLNRDYDSGAVPVTSNLRGSGAIEQWADVVLMMRKMDVMVDANGDPVQDVRRAQASLVEAAVRKARNGTVGHLFEGIPPIGARLHFGVGTFAFWDTTYAPWSDHGHARAERSVRENGWHAEAVN